MIKREIYLKRIRPFYESEMVKVITGIRRCGKSTIMRQIIEEIHPMPKIPAYIRHRSDYLLHFFLTHKIPEN